MIIRNICTQYPRFASTSTITQLSRLPYLSAALKTSPSSVLKEIGLNHKKKIFCNYDGTWFRFKSTKEVIVPFNVAAKIADKMKRNIALFDVDDIPLEREISMPKVPVIAILGHYDHGKTTILDALGGTAISSDEAHGITQIVRSRSVLLKSSDGLEMRTTFIDTPGQEIFFRMRNYGVLVADVALLVVAADEGICSQTEESIGAVEGLGIPVVLCINKIDLPDLKAPTEKESRVQEVVQASREYVILSNAPVITVSALEGRNMQLLIDQITHSIAEAASSTAPALPTASPPTYPTQKSKPLLQCTAYGTVLNVWTNAVEGQMMHVVVAAGEVKTGHWYSAGGWAGAVAAVRMDEEVFQGEQSAGPGMGVTLRMSSKRSTNPSPVGDRVHFFRNRDDALRVADHRYMEVALDSFAISTSEAAAYGLAKLQRLLAEQGRGKNKPLVLCDEALDGDGGVLAAAGERAALQAESGPRGDERIDSSQHAVVKTDTELALCTFADVLAEVAFEEPGDTPSGDLKETGVCEDRGVTTQRLREVIRGGVGDIGMDDVMVASAAKAPILAYAVGIHPAAARQAQNQGVSIYWFDKMQDVVDILLGGNIDGKFLTKKPKRKRTT